MPTSQSQFDADLQSLKDNLATYIAAVNAFIALPPVVDLSAEDDSVKQGITDIQAAQANLPPPPPGP